MHPGSESSRRRRSQSGEGRLGCVIWLAIAAAIGYIAYVILPVKFATSRFEDFMREEAAFGSSKGNPQIIQELLATAREQNIPLTKEQIEIVRTRESITISVHYQVTLSFLGAYEYVWKFDPVVERPLIQT